MELSGNIIIMENISIETSICLKTTDNINDPFVTSDAGNTILGFWCHL